MSSTPPPRPWVKGQQEGYSCAVLEVQVVEDDNGWVFSQLDFQSDDDASTAMGMKGAGVRQVAYALLTESFRREVYLCGLAELSKDPLFVSKYQEASEEERRGLERGLSHAAMVIIMGQAQKMLPDLSREVLGMVAAQLGGAEKGPVE